MSMAKYVTKDGIKRCLLAIKKYIDAIIEQNEKVTATALTKLGLMISGIRDDMNNIDTISEETIENLEELVGGL